jgi:hypothetical protein
MEEKMKKTGIILICTVALAFACVIFAGCSRTEKISSIGIKGQNADDAIEFQIGNFDYEAYTLVVNYDSGSVVEVALSEDMISELDRLKFYQPGDHTITVSHGGTSCELKISVKRNTFGELRFPENTVFTYDGSEHKVEIEGEIPTGATVSYIGGNSFINAGNYDVTAVITCNGYVTEKITTTVTVAPAKYDMSNVDFESKEVVYNGKTHSLEISGQLPEGVAAPQYYINGNPTAGVSDAGVYKVSAVFANKDPNYETIPNMEATLTILPAQYDVGDLDLVFKDDNGSELWFPWKQYDGKTVTFDLRGTADLKNKVSVSYTVYNENEEVISRSNTDTGIKNAGIYTVKAEFLLLDNKNYAQIEPKTYTFEIAKAEFDTSGIIFESKLVKYSGEMNSLAVTIPVTVDVTKFDVSYEYYFSGEDEVIQQDGKNADGVYGAGEYTVRAVFKVKDSNYEEIPPMEAKLVVEKKEISVAQANFYNTDLIYTGGGLKPSFDVGNPEYVTVSDISVFKLEKNGDAEKEIAVEEAIEAGTYRAKVTVSLKDPENLTFYNGSSSVEFIGDFTVREAEIDINGLGFASDGSSLGFDTKKVQGLSFKLTFCKTDGDDRETIWEEEEIFPDENGIISNIIVDASMLPSGTYVCTVTVSVTDSNYVLSNGAAFAEYDYEFSV